MGKLYPSKRSFFHSFERRPRLFRESLMGPPLVPIWANCTKGLRIPLVRGLPLLSNFVVRLMVISLLTNFIRWKKNASVFQTVFQFFDLTISLPLFRLKLIKVSLYLTKGKRVRETLPIDYAYSILELSIELLNCVILDTFCNLLWAEARIILYEIANILKNRLETGRVAHDVYLLFMSGKR